MKRRTALKSLVGMPAGVALTAQTPARAQAPAPASPDQPALAATVPEAVAQSPARFFTPAQFATLRKLADLLAPPAAGLPGALDAEVPEFLDFLVAASPGAVQSLYTLGLDALEVEARRLRGKPFSELAAEEAAPILAPLARPWSYQPPDDPVAAFLRQAKNDVLQATRNSRAWAEAAASRSRRASGLNTYWHPID